MKNFSRYCVASLIVTALILTSVSAFAFPYVANEFNGVFFSNSEVFVDVDGDGLISEGDIFWGVLKVQEIIKTTEDGQTGPAFWYTGLGDPNEITGYFAQEVASVVDSGFDDPNGTDLFNLTFMAPTTDPNGILTGNEALAVYESDTINYDTSSQALGLSTATDGTLAFTLGFADMENYWYTPTVLIDPFTVGDIGESYAGLDFIQQPDFAYYDVNDPNESVYNTAVNFWFNSEIFSLSSPNGYNSATNFHFGSNDPAVFYPVPEPSTFVLLGAGLLGFLVIGRRKK